MCTVLTEQGDEERKKSEGEADLKMRRYRARTNKRSGADYFSTEPMRSGGVDKCTIPFSSDATGLALITDI